MAEGKSYYVLRRIRTDIEGTHGRDHKEDGRCDEETVVGSGGRGNRGSHLELGIIGGGTIGVTSRIRNYSQRGIESASEG
jgi:hypothetical protein